MLFRDNGRDFRYFLFMECFRHFDHISCITIGFHLVELGDIIHPQYGSTLLVFPENAKKLVLFDGWFQFVNITWFWKAQENAVIIFFQSEFGDLSCGKQLVTVEEIVMTTQFKYRGI